MRMTLLAMVLGACALGCDGDPADGDSGDTTSTVDSWATGDPPANNALSGAWDISPPISLDCDSLTGSGIAFDRIDTALTQENGPEFPARYDLTPNWSWPSTGPGAIGAWYQDALITGNLSVADGLCAVAVDASLTVTHANRFEGDISVTFQGCACSTTTVAVVGRLDESGG